MCIGTKKDNEFSNKQGTIEFYHNYKRMKKNHDECKLAATKVIMIISNCLARGAEAKLEEVENPIYLVVAGRETWQLIAARRAIPDEGDALYSCA